MNCCACTRCSAPLTGPVNGRDETETFGDLALLVTLSGWRPREMICRHHRSVVRCRNQPGTRQMRSLGSGWPWRPRMRAAARLPRVVALPGKRILRTIVQTGVCLQMRSRIVVRFASPLSGYTLLRRFTVNSSMLWPTGHARPSWGMGGLQELISGHCAIRHSATALRSL
jgi:hypothetical protein